MDGMVLANPERWVKFRGERNSAALMKKLCHDNWLALLDRTWAA